MDEKKKKDRSREYPAYSLDSAIEFLGNFKDFPYGKPIAYATAAKLLDVNMRTKSFMYKLSAARQFGLIATSSGSTFTFTQNGNALVQSNQSGGESIAMRIECFKNPKLYKELIHSYENKSMPSKNILRTILVSSHGIVDSVADQAADVFLKTAREVGVEQNGVLSFEKFTEKPEVTSQSIRAQDEPAAISLSEQESYVPDLSLGMEFDAPLSIPFGDKRKALLYMPMNISSEDARYALDMIKLMFRRMYKIEV